tara:strand:- start:4636 stop:5583 length:948 start_codon:yes stop_codon:yes gene_type:complete
MVAAGCLVQWYEIDMFEEYLDSLTKSIVTKEKVLIDMCLVTNQDLEKVSDEVDMLTYIMEKYVRICNQYKLQGYQIKFEVRDDLYTIADYRRDFNEKYCELADILFWGESDMLVPSQAMETILSLHEAVKEQTPKWVGFFSTCKMWDDSWKPLEHPKLTDLPRDPHAWYGTRCYMGYDKMEEINSDVESPHIESTYNYKFNGCGLVMSSEIIKSGVNIPKSVFFTHEDTAFMNKMLTIFGNNQIPLYIVKNILLVHNREHPRKRKYVVSEDGKDINEQRKSNDWYPKASEYSKYNAYNFMKQTKTYKWEDVWKVQ